VSGFAGEGGAVEVDETDGAVVGPVGCVEGGAGSVIGIDSDTGGF
jgi:hypothetical protein